MSNDIDVCNCSACPCLRFVARGKVCDQCKLDNHSGEPWSMEWPLG